MEGQMIKLLQYLQQVIMIKFKIRTRVTSVYFSTIRFVTIRN